MGVEKMPCCGALTAVYRDAGQRRHEPGCRHTTTERVLRGQLISQVTFTRFRALMMAEHPDYLTDEQMTDLYRIHVKERDRTGELAQQMVDRIDELLEEPKTKGDLMRELAERQPDEIEQFFGRLTPTNPSAVMGPYDPNRFKQAVNRTRRETKPSLGKRAKKALRRAARKARRR